jgi:uncharacterized protein (DUF697 family)
MLNENKSLPTNQEQRIGGDAIVRRYTLIAAGIGIIPSPTVNSVGIAVMELAMIDELAKNYLYPFPTKLAATKAFISLVGSLGPVYLALKSKSAISAVPLVGHLISSTIYSITGAISVYAVGKIFQMHFESGGTLLSKENSLLRKIFKREAEQGAKEVAKIRSPHSIS